MRLVPSGNRRIMVAQSINPNQDVGIDFGNGVESLPGMPAEQSISNPEIASQDSLNSSDKMNHHTDDKNQDVTQYIFEKLVSLGYPPRRLDAYEEEFVKEKIFPGGSREVAIVIPDRYYGSKKRLSNDDFSSMIEEIQSKFGLQFVDAERSDLKITMNFSSPTPKSEDDEDGAFADDILSQTYGPSKSQKSEKKQDKGYRKAASEGMTISEMIGDAKTILYNRIRKVGE